MIGYSKAKQVGKREKSGLASSKVKKVISEAKPKKRRKPLKKVSKKAKAELKIWHEIRIERMKLLIAKYGHVLCEYCKERSVDMSPDPHHNDRNRRNNELDNCRILHRHCHTKVHDNNIKDVKSLL